MRIKTSFSVLIALAGALVLCGCEDEPIRIYDAPPSAPPAAPASADPNQAAIEWTVPPSWKLQPRSAGGMGIRYATFLIGPPDRQVELTVTRLRPTPANSRALDNVNRWLDLMGLGRTTEEGLDGFVTDIDFAGNKAVLVDIPGPEPDAGSERQHMLAAILPGVRHNWFVKTRGPQDVVKGEKEWFESFVRSIRFTAAAPPRPPVPAATAATDIKFEVPEAWKAQAPGSRMRRAAFTVSDEGRSAEVLVSAFPGNVGTALANLNRWRRQVGLPPADSLTGATPRPIEAVNAGGSLVELAGPGSGESGPKRLLVAHFLYGQQSWFIKMLGDDGLVRRQKDTFAAFVGSVRFVEQGDG